jgi:hypothetical protein
MALKLTASDSTLAMLLERIWQDDIADVKEYLELMRSSDNIVSQLGTGTALADIQLKADELVKACRTFVRASNQNAATVSLGSADKPVEGEVASRDALVLSVEYQLAYVVVAVEAILSKV